MRLTFSRSIAAVSLAALLTAAMVLNAARRPRYGGGLRVEPGAILASFDPAVVADDPTSFRFKEQLVPSVFETLVRIDDRGNPQPNLATGWTRDAARKRWVFTPRSNVMLHNGTQWT